jgi:hypothetical protein
MLDRSLILLTCLAGCGGYAGPRSVVNDDPAVKIPEIRRAVDRDDRSIIGQLLNDLDSDDPAVRFYAHEALERFAGAPLTFDWHEADRADRRDAIAAIRDRFGMPTTQPLTRPGV